MTIARRGGARRTRRTTCASAALGFVEGAGQDRAHVRSIVLVSSQPNPGLDPYRFHRQIATGPRPSRDRSLSLAGKMGDPHSQIDEVIGVKVVACVARSQIAREEIRLRAVQARREMAFGDLKRLGRPRRWRFGREFRMSR